MSQQRRIDLLFAATVRAMDFARVLRNASPALAVGLVSVVAVHGTLGGTDAPAFSPRVADAVPSPSSEGQPSAAVALVSPVVRGEPTVRPLAALDTPAPEVAAPPLVTPPLDREQQNIAKFIAARYRLTVDATSEFVYHAFRAAKDTKVDPMLVLAVMSVESSFNPRAQSVAGAQGLMQVLTRVHVEKFLPFGGIPAAFDPVANIRVGSVILKEYIQREGSVEGALKSYVGAALAEHDGGYGMKVLNARDRIAAAAAGRPIPPEIVASAPVQRAEREPVMQPVSRIVETRTPMPVVEESRAPSATDAPQVAGMASYGVPHASPYAASPYSEPREADARTASHPTAGKGVGNGI
jgi:soluble lytic murein transglycosylase-like protein